MRFTTLSLILAVSTIFSATTCNGQDFVSPATAPPAATDEDHPQIVFNKESKIPMMVSPPTGAAPQMMNHDNLHALSRQFLFPDYLIPARVGNIQDATTMQPHFVQQIQPEVLPNQKNGELQKQGCESRLTKRMGPRRLAGERRDGGLLGNVVGDLATLTATVSAAPTDDPSLSPTPSSTFFISPPPVTVAVPTEIAPDPVPLPTAAPSPTPSLPHVDPEPVTTTTNAEAGPTPAPTPAPKTDAPVVPVSIYEPPADSPSSSDEGAPAETLTHPSPAKETHSNSKLTPFANGPTNDSSSYASDDVQGQGGATTTNEESSGNGMGVTIGIIVAVVAVACAIGVWIFRKWKLSPSRQFKSKISAPSSVDNTSSDAIVGAFADNATVYGSSGYDTGSDYQNSYDAIYNHQTHDPNAALSHQQQQPPMEYMMSAASSTSLIAATAMSTPVAAYQQQQQYSHPYEQQQAYGYEQEYIQHDQYAYGQQQYGHQHYAYQQHPQQYQHQAHLSMSSTASGSVTDYGQYQHSHSGSTASAGAATGMATGASGAGGSAAMVGSAPMTGHNIHGYGSEDYSQNDQFLRELRE